MSIRTFPMLGLLLGLIASPVRAEGAALVLRNAPPPPDQAVRTDPARPAYRLALLADPLGAIRGEYGLGLRKALGRYQAVDFTPAFVAVDGARGLSLEVGYAVLPLGRGLAGPYVELLVGGLVARVDGGPRDAVRFGGEAGYVHVLSGVCLGGAFGVVVHHALGGQSDAELVLRARVFLGYAFL